NSLRVYPSPRAATLRSRPMPTVSRRQFLGAAAIVSVAAAAGRAIQPAAPDAKSPLERRRFGKTDLDVTVLGFGGAEIGYQNVDQAVIDTILTSALDAGLNVIDTAECYAGSEEAIGKAVSGRRKEYHLFTKVGHAFGSGAEGWTTPSIAKSIDRSLERLKTD